MFYSFGLTPTITRPTRITHSSSTLIDNIYISLGKYESSYSGIILNDISDHLPVFTFNRSKEDKKQVKMKTRNYSEANIQEINNYLESVDWNCIGNLGINEAYNYFQDHINEALDMFAPLKTIIIKGKDIIHERWMTKGLLRAGRKQHKLYKKQLGKCKTHRLHTEYIEYRNTLNKIKRKAKRDYYFDLLNKYKNNTRKTWKLLNSVIGKSNDKSVCRRPHSK